MELKEIAKRKQQEKMLLYEAIKKEMLTVTGFKKDHFLTLKYLIDNKKTMNYAKYKLLTAVIEDYATLLDIYVNKEDLKKIYQPQSKTDIETKSKEIIKKQLIEALRKEMERIPSAKVLGHQATIKYLETGIKISNWQNYEILVMAVEDYDTLVSDYLGNQNVIKYDEYLKAYPTSKYKFKKADIVSRALNLANQFYEGSPLELGKEKHLKELERAKKRAKKHVNFLLQEISDVYNDQKRGQYWTLVYTEIDKLPYKSE